MQTLYDQLRVAPVSEALPVVVRVVAAGRPLLQWPWAVARFMANKQRHRPAPVEAHCEVAQQLAQHLRLGRGVIESARSAGARPLT